MFYKLKISMLKYTKQQRKLYKINGHNLRPLSMTHNNHLKQTKLLSCTAHIRVHGVIKIANNNSGVERMNLCDRIVIISLDKRQYDKWVDYTKYTSELKQNCFSTHNTNQPKKKKQIY